LQLNGLRVASEQVKAKRGSMNWLPFRGALVFSFAASLLVSASAHAEKRVALVIGNNDYKNVPKLQRAVNDARAMGDTLKQLGFVVMVAENQTRQAFSESLLAFDKAVGPGDTAFFFYAGHGFEIAGQNFLLPNRRAGCERRPGRTGARCFGPCRSHYRAAAEQERAHRDSGVRRLPQQSIRTSGYSRVGRRRRARADDATAGRVFSVFSAGPRQTALDRLSNSDDNPNSVFTRTFAKELLKPGENLVQVVQHTRRAVSEMAETVNHKQIPVYFDQMVDDVFLNGMAKESDTPKEATKEDARPPQQMAALPPVQRISPTPSDSVNAPIAMFSRHNGGCTVVFSILDPALGISWRIGDSGDFRETGFLDTLDPRTRKRIPNPSIELPADAPAATIQVRYVDIYPARCRVRFRSSSIRRLR
jgi:hypothetical protein